MRFDIIMIRYLNVFVCKSGVTKLWVIAGSRWLLLKASLLEEILNRNYFIDGINNRLLHSKYMYKLTKSLEGVATQSEYSSFHS